MYVCICICFTLNYFIRKKFCLSLEATTRYWFSYLALQRSGNSKKNWLHRLISTYGDKVTWFYILPKAHTISFISCTLDLRKAAPTLFFFNSLWYLYNFLKQLNYFWSPENDRSDLIVSSSPDSMDDVFWSSFPETHVPQAHPETLLPKWCFYENWHTQGFHSLSSLSSMKHSLWDMLKFFGDE